MSSLFGARREKTMHSQIRAASGCGIAAAVFLLLAPEAGAQWFTYPSPGVPRTTNGKPILTSPAPRTADGHPDLSGFWRRRAGSRDLTEQDLLPWASALFTERRENYLKDGPFVTCLPWGPAALTFDNDPFKVLQSREQITLLWENLTFRQIFMDGRALPKDPNPTWMGYSVARWDGDALVVDSSGFTERSWLEMSGTPHSEALRITERYQRRDLGHMALAVTIDDPKTFTRPWHLTFELELDPDAQFLEYVCAENEKSRAHMVGRIPDAESTGVNIDPAVLETYVGRYEGTRPDGTLVRVSITREGGVLFFQRDGRARMQLTPLSRTRFSGAAEYEFVSDANGVVTHFVTRAVEGEMKAIRQR
jgi:hypothetical protein